MTDQFNKVMGAAIQDALKKLLCEKHLYQYVEVDLRPLEELAAKLRDENPLAKAAASTSDNSMPSLRSVVLAVYHWTEGQFKTAVARHVVPWVIQGAPVSEAEKDFVPFALPHINTFCSECKGRPPFNPVNHLSSCLLQQGHDQDQCYTLAYECQQCHSLPVRFLVRRQSLKLRLVGRDPIEAIPPPPALKGPTKFYSDAVVAHHAGQTLAGVFLLRTYVEQYWRTVPTVQAKIKERPRATGDEQGEAYQATLPADLKSRFPSLSDIYGKLSAAMHDANADGALFGECCGRIVEHFEARRLFKL
jgi:hypothetical protein